MTIDLQKVAKLAALPIDNPEASKAELEKILKIMELVAFFIMVQLLDHIQIVKLGQFKYIIEIYQLMKFSKITTLQKEGLYEFIPSPKYS